MSTPVLNPNSPADNLPLSSGELRGQQAAVLAEFDLAA
ncbi:MAG: hypothetical protein BWX68_02340 [Verrucomicrobia bacterium ADurb.Bin063]|jgi:hypothetical protein|nr:MAG: hypothetical protein BWX68_02340 [Verrucomicrobia bacterium ADurb.Bin063]